MTSKIRFCSQRGSAKRLSVALPAAAGCAPRARRDMSPHSCRYPVISSLCASNSLLGFCASDPMTSVIAGATWNGSMEPLPSGCLKTVRASALCAVMAALARLTDRLSS